MTTTLVLHHLDNSRSQRVLWLLEELGLAYEVRRYARDKRTQQAPPELRQVHALGKAPVLSDGGIVLAESGAIIEYLLDTYDAAGRLRPPAGSEARRRFTYWLHFAEGTAMPPLLLKLVFDRVRTARTPLLLRPLLAPVARGIADRVTQGFIRPNIERQLAFMEGELAGRDWFAGDALSAADVQMSFPLEAARVRGGLDGRYPNLIAWLERIHARPAYRRALEVGGPYTILRA